MVGVGAKRRVHGRDALAHAGYGAPDVGTGALDHRAGACCAAVQSDGTLQLAVCRCSCNAETIREAADESLPSRDVSPPRLYFARLRSHDKKKDASSALRIDPGPQGSPPAVPYSIPGVTTDCTIVHFG
jgi:hypothetical protein